MIVSDYLQKIIDRTGNIARALGWDKDWNSGGCYIHLEVSEFIEALRGRKKGDNPKAEAADVVITLFSVMEHYGITSDDLLEEIENKLHKLELKLAGVNGNV